MSRPLPRSWARSSNLLTSLRHSRAVALVTLVAWLAPMIVALIPSIASAAQVTTPIAMNASPSPAIQAGEGDLGMPASSGQGVSTNVDGSTGTFHSTIPFELPQARGAVQPHLSLQYSSAGGMGVGGRGWSLSMPTIERHNPSGLPHYNSFDAYSTNAGPAVDQFVFAGRTLLRVCALTTSPPSCVEDPDHVDHEQMPSWAQNWTYYRLEVEDGSNLRFFLSPDNRTWLVQRPDGSSMVFGVPLDSSQDESGLDYEPLHPSNKTNAAPFRYNLVREFDAQRIPGTTATTSYGTPSNVVQYVWSALTLPGIGTDANPIHSLTDIYDTPPVGVAAPATTSFAHHTHLSYVNDPTWMVPNSSPTAKARAVVRLTGVDVTSATFAGTGRREQVRRYVLSYTKTWTEYELTQVKTDGWCASNPPLEDQTTSLLPAVSSQAACGTGATGHDWPPPTTFTYATRTPSAAFYRVPAHTSTLLGLPAIFDINADGMPDLIYTDFLGGQTVALNSVDGQFNSWKSQPLTLSHAASGATMATMNPWNSAYVAGSFLNNGLLTALIFDASWSSSTSAPAGTVGVPYSLYSPTATGTTSWDWGVPSTSRTNSLVPSCMNNCGDVPATVTGAPGSSCIVGSSYLGCDRKLMNADIDGDAFPDLIVSSVYGNGSNSTVQVVGGCLGGKLCGQMIGTSVNSLGLNVRFTTRDTMGSVSPFAVPGPQALPDASGMATESPGSAPNICVEGITDAQRLMTYLPWTMGDMNGDGLSDWINLAGSGVQIYFGHGDGVFGSCDPKREDSIASLSVACTCNTNMTALGRMTPANLVNTANAQLNAQFHDVDGNGLDDIIMPTNDGFDVYFNSDGEEFEAFTLHVPAAAALGWTDTSATSAWSHRNYLFADMNGSGVDDIVILDSKGNVGYVDLVGPNRLGLLTSVKSGTGAVTQVQYDDLASQSRIAMTTLASPWSKQSPQAARVVAAVITSDATPNVLTPDIYTSYLYRDPVYDARDRVFVGFTSVEQVTRGDATEPTSHVKTTFYQGHCEGTGTSPCLTTTDYPARGMRGLPILTEIFGDVTQNSDGMFGPALSTTHRQFTAQKIIYTSQGNVTRVWPSQVDTFLFDNSAAVNRHTAQSVPDVYLNGSLMSQQSFMVSANAVHLLTKSTIDKYGLSTTTFDYGQVDAHGASTEGIIESSEVLAPVPEPTDHWIWRTTSSSVTGADANLNATGVGHQRTFAYDARGNVLRVYAPLSGSVGMTRATVVSGGGDAGATSPPAASQPPGASVDPSSLLLTQFTPDKAGTGNIVRVEQPGTQQCTDLVFDAAFSALPTSSLVYVSGCGSAHPLASAVQGYVRGLALPTSVLTADNLRTVYTYESYGRVHTVTKPSPTFGGGVEAFAGVTITYNDTATPQTVQMQTSNGTTSRSFWTVKDGFGRALFSAVQADTSAGDAKAWIVSGRTVRNARGDVSQAYVPMFVDDWTTLPLHPAASEVSRAAVYDAFGRATVAADIDKTLLFFRSYLALGYTEKDTEQLKPAGVLGPHGGQASAVGYDGHGRVSVTQATGNGGYAMTQYHYLPTGEVSLIERIGADKTSSKYTQRWMQYDSLGRLVRNAEPSATSNFVAMGASPFVVPSTVKGWTYAYDDASRLVATTDARGCGENILYDGASRRVAEDYFGCLPTHAAYTPANATTGVGAEAFYSYVPASSQIADVYDRAAHTHYAYDARGRVASVQRNIAQPNAVPTPTSGYAPHTFETKYGYDEFNRIIAQTTGEEPSVSNLNGTSVPIASGTTSPVGSASSTSALILQYSKRGVVTSVTGSYGLLIRQNIFDADGRPLVTSWGDIAPPPVNSKWPATSGTQTLFNYDGRNRLTQLSIARSAPALWTNGASPYTRPPTSPIATTQTVLAAELTILDGVGNPTSVNDGRLASEWTGAPPVSRISIGYDDFYRVTGSTNSYFGPSTVVPAPALTSTEPTLPMQSIATRTTSETFAYDPLGNITSSGDDANLFFDRSLGQVTSGTAAGAATASGPVSTNQVKTAQGAGGSLTTSFDATGNLVQLAVNRTGTCLSDQGCSQLFHYDWDEAGRLVRARRFDFLKCPKFVGCRGPSDKYSDPTTIAYPAMPSDFAATADVTYAYDHGGNRVVRGSLQTDGTELYTVDVFPSLRLNHTTFAKVAASDYDRSDQTDQVYLVAGGLSLGRVVFWSGAPVTASATTPGQHVLLEMSDRLGSTAAVIDRDTSELVERTTYSTYGRVESDYRPDRWKDFSETGKFTGKEEDEALGLSYFGARYYSPYLGSWISADPLTIHALGGDANPYAYVHGRTFAAIDADGFSGGCIGSETVCGNEGPGPGWGSSSGGSSGSSSGSSGGGGSSSSGGSSLPTHPVPAYGPVTTPANPGNPSGPVAIPLWQALGQSNLWAQQVDPNAVAGFNNGVDRNGTVLGLAGMVAAAQASVLAAMAGAPAAQALGRGFVAADEALTAAAKNAASSLGSLGRWASSALGLGGAGAATNCFAAGTKVAMCDGGQQPIETLQVGDQVLAANENGGIECRAIRQTFRNVSHDQAITIIRGADGEEEELRTTMGHPFWIEGRGWTPVRQLAAGDEARGLDGTPRWVVSVRLDDVVGEVYNLEVDGLHDYFVGSARVLVHNGCIEEIEEAAEGLAKFTASTPQSAIALSKQLASEAQLGEMAAGAGRPIAGPGADAVFRDSARIAQTYGGNAADWAKMSSSGFSAADGTTFATHWVENVVTGAQAEPKVVIDIFGGP